MWRTVLVMDREVYIRLSTTTMVSAPELKNVCIDIGERRDYVLLIVRNF